MSDQRLGTALRQVRIRRGLRQRDVARLASTSQSTVSRAERGHLDSLSVDTIRRVGAVLDVRIDLVARWRAGDLDRLLNSRHSMFHEVVSTHLARVPGWTFIPEVSFAIHGERGIVDILAFHEASDTVLVIELKTDLADLNELVGTVDRKRRLAIGIARLQDWPIGAAARASVWVIVAASTTNRRRIGAHRSMLRAAFPVDGRAIGGWLARPDRAVRALSIWSDSHGQTLRVDLRSVRRVARPKTRARAVRP
jgi:transcriptional regulator with XRE-family HTH domain